MNRRYPVSGTIRWGGRYRLAGVAVSVGLVTAGLTQAQEMVLAQEARDLQRQVLYLSESLACAQAELDGLKAREDRIAFAAMKGTAPDDLGAASVVEDQEYRILEVNRELGVVILNAGRPQGVRPGLELSVIRSEKVIGTLRVIDARSRISGAVVLRLEKTYPRAQDRVIMATGSKE